MLRSSRNYTPEKQLKTQFAQENGDDKSAGSKTARMQQFAEVFSEAGVYEQLLESLNEGIVIVDKRLKVQYTNIRFSYLVRRARTELIGSSLGELLVVSRRQGLAVLLRRSLNYPCSHEGELYYENGRRLRVQVSVCAVGLNNQVLFVITVNDLSLRHQFEYELRRTEEELRIKNAALEKANVELSSFTFIASHHLQEPLRKIQLFVNLIADTKQALPVETTNYFRRIIAAVSRMQALIADLLTFCSIRSNEFPLVLTDLDLLLREALRSCAGTPLHKIITEIKGRLPVLKVIPFQIKLLFQHLLTNAVKFCPPEKVLQLKIKCRIEMGNIDLGLKLSEKYYRISFTDNGMGFDEKYKDRIFEMFQKLHRNDQYEGTGMGLALCRRIVEKHRGVIVGSSRQGCGARFDIYLPVK